MKTPFTVHVMPNLATSVRLKGNMGRYLSDGRCVVDLMNQLKLIQSDI